MSSVLSFSEYEILVLESQLQRDSQKCLCPKIWTKCKDGNWEIQGSVQRKLQRLAQNFFEFLRPILGDKEIQDIQITGDLSNFSYENSPDLDLHILLDLSSLSGDELVRIQDSLQKLKLKWEIENNPTVRGFHVDSSLQDINDPHSDSGLYSLNTKKWLKNPGENLEADQRDTEKKVSSLQKTIDAIDSKIELENTPEEFKRKLHEKAISLKRRIQKMRTSSISDSKLNSVSANCFKKLKNGGYIDKLLSIISKANPK